jgi:hypothetical protein
MDDTFIKPYLIYDYAVRKVEIESTTTQMNIPQSNQTCRATIIADSNNAETIINQIRESKLVDSTNMLKSRVFIRSSMSTKFAGQQDIELNLDMPLLLEDIRESE